MFRQSLETKIFVSINPAHSIYIQTGLPFIDHMLDQISHHSMLQFSLCASGDVCVDSHHLVEDIGLVVGTIINSMIARTHGWIRYINSVALLDETATHLALDASGRSALIIRGWSKTTNICTFNTQTILEFLNATARVLGATIHLIRLCSYDVHHQVETSCKSLGQILQKLAVNHKIHHITTKGLFSST